MLQYYRFSHIAYRKLSQNDSPAPLRFNETTHIGIGFIGFYTTTNKGHRISIDEIESILDGEWHT